MQVSSKLSQELESLNSLSELFNWRVQRSPEAEAYRQFDDSLSKWRSYSWQEMAQQILAYQQAMHQSGARHGDRIGILLPNGVTTVCVDQACLALACVPVPMHALDNPESIAFILADSEARLLIAESLSQWLAIQNAGYKLDQLTHVIVLKLDGDQQASTHQVLSLEQWLQTSQAQPDLSKLPAAAADDLAALVYTSGTTGKPKGVMLSHQNVLANVKAVVARVTPLPSDVFLSFLPLSHTFERTGGYYTPIAGGSAVVFSRSIKQLPEDLQQVAPTILVSVPRIYERVLGKIESDLAGSVIKSWLFQQAVSTGWRRYRRHCGTAQGGMLQQLIDQLSWPVYKSLIAQKLQRQFGGRLRLAVSGGAALSNHVAQTFLGLGIPVAQGYGMTETSPVIAANIPLNDDPGSVGAALDGVQVRIGDNQELQVRGPSVMRGYWKRPEDTEKTFIDGWLKTGDQARIEADGKIRILGRVKEIIVTSTGEKIAPVDLEQAILSDSQFEQAFVFGDNRSFISCAVVLNQASWQKLAQQHGLASDQATSLQHPALRQQLLSRVRELTTSFPYYAQPRGIIVCLEPWTVENSLMTPTLKLKRNNLNAHFATQIEALYQGKAGA